MFYKTIEKLKDIYENLIFQIVEFPDKIKRFKIGIKNLFQWFSTIYRDRNYDYFYLLDLEYFKLKKMYKYFSTANIVEDEWHIALTIKRAMSVLEIILEEDKPYRDYLHDNYSDVSYIESDDGLYKTSERELTVPVKVNIRNAYRFYKPKNPIMIKNLKENYGLYAMELRKMKAIHIYYEMRKLYTYDWWD